jgi:cell wall-associated NlpC family hydrolase
MYSAVCLFVFMCIGNYLHGTAPFPQQALVIVPVADLVGEPLQNPAAFFEYKTLPVCGGTINTFASCPRIHQVLFNEQVTAHKQVGNEVLISIPNLFYITDGDKNKKNTLYWTLRSNIAYLDELPPVNIKKLLPIPIDFKKGTITEKNAVTLLFPFHDATTGLTFSAGTRFKKTDDKRNSNSQSVHVFNPTTNTWATTLMPASSLLTTKNGERSIETFIRILKIWATHNNGCIPYVWGGCSFIDTSSAHQFTEQRTRHGDTDISYFAITDYNHTPKTGLDCSGLIARAAQMVGIPYFFKNTSTLAHYVPPLDKKHTLKDGDLIGTKGHVMVVSSIKNNTLIEARSYEHGYGRVHEIPLNRVFKDVNTYQDLIDAYFNKKTIYRIDKKGTVKDTIPEFKLLRLNALAD